MAEKEFVIDCDSKILGRLASHVAKMLLKGNKVVLVNAERAAISGHARGIVAEYKRRVELQDKANPEHSPYWSRRPDFLVKRIVRGMLPYKKTKGRDAYGRLRVYVGIPAEFSKVKFEKVQIKEMQESYENSISVKELSERLGYEMK
ncbi:MAG: 50S ribosomal protein L13 [Candidatus Micrarchaeales archaeon]|jgi:large subunit ribosomal protein L13